MIKRINVETGEIMPQFKTMYNFDRDAESLRTGTACEPETITQQQFKDECDINLIMKKFGVTGEIPHMKVRPVMPEEYDEVFDFQSAMNVIRKAQEAFMEMPSGVRARFQNNPQVFTEFFADPENRMEAEKMGLVLPRPIEAPIVAPEGDGEP